MRVLLPTLLAGLLLCSCSKTSGGGQHATVELRDGTSVTGTVVSTSPSEIQIAGDDKLTRTIAMNQVRSIEYDENPTAPAGAPPEATGSAPAPAPKTAAARPRKLEHREHYHPPEQAVTTRTHQLPEGTEISVRNEETIDSGKAAEGQTFPAEVTKDVLDNEGNVVIPAGANAQIVIRSASKGGRIQGASDLVLDLATVSIDGRQYDLSTTDLSQKGHNGIGVNRRTGEFTGGGAAIGAIIGAIAGGGKGAAIGGGSGAAAGAITQVLTKGTIKVPVESVLTFKLDMPLRVNARS
jgi:outer membrane lipoprotein SlyB